MKNLFALFSFFALSVAHAQNTLPKGCEASLVNKQYGEARIQKALHKQGSAKAYASISKVVGPGARGISETDLKEEILYYSPLTKKCALTQLKETPFGNWVQAQLDYRKLQKLEEPGVAYMPVEIDAAYDIKHWLSLSLSQRASLFDRRAASGFDNLTEKCKDGSQAQLTEYAEQFLKYYEKHIDEFVPK